MNAPLTFASLSFTLFSLTNAQILSLSLSLSLCLSLSLSYTFSYTQTHSQGMCTHAVRSLIYFVHSTTYLHCRHTLCSSLSLLSLFSYLSLLHMYTHLPIPNPCVHRVPTLMTEFFILIVRRGTIKSIPHSSSIHFILGSHIRLIVLCRSFIFGPHFLLSNVVVTQN